MDAYAIILVAIGIVLLVGFLKQFGILGGRGFIFAISAAALFFGFSIFQTYRRKKLDEEFKKREDELKNQEETLQELEKEYELSKEEVYAAEAALRQEKGYHKKRVAEIAIEKEKNIEEARERVNNMSINELLDKF